jgi:hypothetical protein
MKRSTQATPAHSEQDLITCRLIVISRYVDNIRTLSRLAERLGHLDLGTAMMEVARGMEGLSYDIATSETGTLVLRRAAKLIGTVDGVFATKARRATLH